MSVPASLGVPVLTLAEARKLITAGPPTGLLADDATVQRGIDSATSTIERYVGPIVVRQVSKTMSGGVTSYVLPWRPLVQYDMSLVENGVPLVNVGVDFDIDADAGILYRGHWPATLWFTMGRNNVVFTCYAGRDVLPPGLKDAVAMQFRNVWQEWQQSPARPGMGVQPARGGGLGGAAAGPGVDPIAIALAACDVMPGFA